MFNILQMTNQFFENILNDKPKQKSFAAFFRNFRKIQSIKFILILWNYKQQNI